MAKTALQAYQESHGTRRDHPGQAPVIYNKDNNRSGGAPSEDQLRALNYDAGLAGALRNIDEQRYFDQATDLGIQADQFVANQALQAPTPYALDPNDDGGIAARAREAGTMGNQLAARASMPQAADALINQASGGAGAALRAAGTLGGPGSFQGQSQAALQGMGDQVGQFQRDTGMLRDAAAGRGPSAATSLMEAGLDKNARNMQALAASTRGGNMASAIRSATQAGRDAGLQNINQAAALRANEQLGAMGQLTGANAAISGAQAQQAGAINQAGLSETQRQAAAAAAATGAANAATGVAGVGSGLEGARLGAIGTAGGLVQDAVKSEIANRGVSAGIASDAAKDAEEQRRRALAAAQHFQGSAINQATRGDTNRNISKQGEITGKDLLAAGTGAAASGASIIGAAIPKGG